MKLKNSLTPKLKAIIYITFIAIIFTSCSKNSEPFVKAMVNIVNDGSGSGSGSNPPNQPQKPTTINYYGLSGADPKVQSTSSYKVSNVTIGAMRR
jgi:PBP1b-binding outer membrane lipoprotein LpoB